MEPAHLPNNTTFLLSKPLKFQIISCNGSKVIICLLPERHTPSPSHRLTDRHTDTHFASLYEWVRFFSMWNYTFHYTMFLHLLRSFTHFVCEG